MVEDRPHRTAPTPKGLEAVEKGTLKHFDMEMWSDLNSGVLEQYLEEKNRRESFKTDPFKWRKVSVGIILGTIFAVITEYVGLKVGIAISGGWYVVYIIGLALRWNPREVNITAGASTGATYIASGFIFTFPALYLLGPDSIFDQYLVGGKHLIERIPPIPVVLIATIVAGFIGILYFIIFRRIWLIEDPLHVPGIEANVKLLDMSHSISRGAIKEAKRALRIVFCSIGAVMFFTFLKDWPLNQRMDALLDKAFGGKYYSHSTIMHPYAHYTHVDFGLIPIQLGIGWFMKFRVALLVSMGTLLTWFVIIPLAVQANVGVFIGAIERTLTLTGAAGYESVGPAVLAYHRIARVIAIGAILGGGVTGLLKMAPTFKAVASDVLRTRGGKRKDWVRGKGWYEWPVTHIKIMSVISLVLITLVFWLGGYPFLPSLIFSIVLVGTTFILGAIAVKVMGETGSEPVSGTSFIVLLMLIGIFFAIGTDPGTTAVMAIIGTTVFGGAISMSGDIIWDFKSGIYCGNRPYHLMKGELTGIIPGGIAGAIGAVILSQGLATGKLNLIAPQAHAFATMVQTLFGGGPQVVQYLALGIFIGVFAEMVTGMGTAFGLGMYFPLSLTLPMLLGGGLRDLWEKKWLEPKAKREKWSEREKTLKLIDSYMMATGLIVGEALMGTIIAIYVMVVM